MKLRSLWPVYALLLAALAGAITGGFGGAVLAVTLTFLVVGPGYLIQQRVRRRRGYAPSGQGLDRDADEEMTRLALVYLRAFKRSRLLRLCVYAGNLAIFAGLWLIAGPGWALASVGLWLAVAAIGVIQGRRTRH